MKKVFTMYVDESGDNLIYELDKWTDKCETHCTLLGTIVPHSDKGKLTKELNIIKNDIFKTKEVVLHSVDIRFKRGAFVVFHYQPELYNEFKASMNTLTNNLRPQLICSSLDKKKWVEKYPRKVFFDDDPYEQAFVYMLERYAHYLNSQEGSEVVGKIIIEDRGNQEVNKKLQKVYDEVRDYGTQYIDKEKFSRLHRKLDFMPKHYNIPGLQLSDYFAYPFYINHKDPRRENKHYEFLEQFIYPGDRKNYGHKKWPV
jgi:hypothetical protein